MERYGKIIPADMPVKKDGTGEVTVFFESDKLLYAAFTLEPGCSLNQDIHPGGDEGYFILEGELTVELPEVPATNTVHAGEVFYIGAGLIHIARNEGSGPVRVLAAIGPKA